MSYTTIIQAPFMVSTTADLDVTWPDGTFAFCRADNSVYQLNSGVWGVINNTMQAYVNGTKYANAFPYFSSATVTSGIATFYLTDNGLSTGNAVFPNNVFTQSINLITSDLSNTYQYGTFTVAANKKSIAINVNKLGLSLGILVFTVAANGITVFLQITGN